MYVYLFCLNDELQQTDKLILKIVIFFISGQNASHTTPKGTVIDQLEALFVNLDNIAPSVSFFFKSKLFSTRLRKHKQSISFSGQSAQRCLCNYYFLLVVAY